MCLDADGSTWYMRERSDCQGYAQKESISWCLKLACVACMECQCILPEIYAQDWCHYTPDIPDRLHWIAGRHLQGRCAQGRPGVEQEAGHRHLLAPHAALQRKDPWQQQYSCLGILRTYYRHRLSWAGIIFCPRSISVCAHRLLCARWMSMPVLASLDSMCPAVYDSVSCSSSQSHYKALFAKLTSRCMPS